MILRQLTERDVFAAKSLWQFIFRDTDAFANFFFSHRFTPRLSYGAFEADTLVSMALARAVRTDRPDCTAVMISGVSTHPVFRHSGLMTELMHRLLAGAAARGYALALLSPAIRDLYRPFGFVPLTYAIETTECAEPSDMVVRTDDARRLLAIYRAAAETHPMLLHRGEEEMRLALKEYAAERGVTLYLRDGGGYLCFLPHDDGVEVTECLAASPDGYRTLLRHAASCSPSRLATARLPVDCAQSGTLLRPIHGLALKEDVSLDAIAKERRSFCVERY